MYEWVNSKGLSFPDSGGGPNINLHFILTVRFNHKFCYLILRKRKFSYAN